MNTDTRPYDEFALPSLDTEPASSRLQDLILPPGYITAIDPATGQMVAVKTAEQPLPSLTPQPEPDPEPELEPEPTAFEKAQAYAKEQPDPLPAAPVPAVQGLNPAIWQGTVVVGAVSLATLPVGAAIWIACDGLHVAGPWFHDATQFLTWVVIALVVAVVVLVTLASKVKAAMTSTVTEGGTVVNALVHKHTEVHIGKQSAGWKGSVNNNVR